jgi:hypothetical protein
MGGYNVILSNYLARYPQRLLEEQGKERSSAFDEIVPIEKEEDYC